MKKYLQMLIMFSMLSHAQVGINTTDVHPSAILDLGINNNKALLITRVALTGTDDLITIPTPAAGLIVYNTQTTSGSNAVIGNEIYFFKPLCGGRRHFSVKENLEKGCKILHRCAPFGSLLRENSQ